MEADLACGRWDQAVEAACSALAGPGPASNLERCNMMLVLAKVRARRGAGDYWPLLDEARDLGGQANVAYQLPSIAAARAEATWLEGRLADVATEADLARGIGLNLDPLAVLDLDCWRWRAGADIGAPADLPEPYRMLLAGDWRGAQLWWREHGCPYEAALAVMGSADVTALRGAAEGLRALGAWAALAIVVRELRSLGERSVPREPRAATRGNPGGLTEREVEVLRLISAGMHNAEIATHLYLSARTVDHHVAAILRKFSVRSRSEAVAAAVRLGLVQT